MEPEFKMIKKLQSMIHDRRNRVSLYCRSEYWDKKAEMMYGHAVSMWPNNALNEYYHQEHLQALHDGLGDVKGLHILDVGCGAGRMSRYLAEKGALVHGFDFSIKTVEIAKALSKSSNPSYEVLSLFDLHENQAYDIALSWGVVTVACTNAEQLAEGLQRIHHALKSNGRLMLMEPIHASFLHRVLKLNTENLSRSWSVKASNSLISSTFIAGRSGCYLPICLGLDGLPRLYIGLVKSLCG